ncbi:MAG: repressor LexA [Chloroflexi bacterium]|nr:repressor LexA [Chloroflexota bacterium]
MSISELGEDELRIWKFIGRYQRENARRSPTYGEIKRAVGIASKDHIARDLKKLRAARCIAIDRGVTRGIRLLRDPFGQASVRVPLLGVIHAGMLNPVIEQTLPIEWIDVARDLVGDAQNAESSFSVYMLKVNGDSMLDALVNDGDLVVMQLTPVAKNGDLVAAWIKSKQAITLKRYFRKGNWVTLKAENPMMHLPPYPAKDVEVQGKVLCIIRKANGKAIMPS